MRPTPLLYVKQLHGPSSVVDSLFVPLTHPERPDLVLARPDRIELYTVEARGISLQSSLRVRARIASIAEGSSRSILVLTDIGSLFIVKITPETHSAKTLELFEACGYRGDIESQKIVLTPLSGQQFLVHDEKKRFWLSYSSIGSATIYLPSRSGNSIPESLQARAVNWTKLNILSIAILYVDRPLTVIVLSRDYIRNADSEATITKYKLTINDHTGIIALETSANSTVPVPFNASTLLPISRIAGGFFVLGEGAIGFGNLRSTHLLKQKRHSSLGIPSSWGSIGDDGERHIIGDNKGKLFMLSVQYNEDRIVDWNLEFICITSISTVIRYMSSGYAFLGSHFGPSIVFRLRPAEKKGDKLGFEVVQEFPNIAPITDFLISTDPTDEQSHKEMDLPDSASFIVSCPNSQNDGSLRSVRLGIGIEVLAETETAESPVSQQVTGTWFLPYGKSLSDLIIVVSTFDSTRIFNLSNDATTNGNPDIEIEELSAFDHLITQTATIEIISLNEEDTGSSTFQVLADRVIDIRTGNTFKAESIMFASFSNRFLLICSEEKKATVLDTKLAIQATHIHDKEISCMDILEDQQGKTMCGFGFWDSQDIYFYRIPDFYLIGSFNLKVPAVPRALKFLVDKISSTDESKEASRELTKVAVGLGNGCVVFTDISLSDNYKLQETNTKNAWIGSLPVSLFRQSTNSLIVISDRTAIINLNDGLVSITSINIQHPSAIATLGATRSKLFFENENVDRLVVLCESGSLLLGFFDPVTSAHINNLCLKRSPRRICRGFDNKGRSFIVALTSGGDVNRSNGRRMKPPYSYEDAAGYIELIDQNLDLKVDEIKLTQGEKAVAITRVEGLSYMSSSLFVVATIFSKTGESGEGPEDNHQEISGRLLLLSLDQSSEVNVKLVQLHERMESLTVFSLAPVVSREINEQHAYIAMGCHGVLTVLDVEVEKPEPDSPARYHLHSTRETTHIPTTALAVSTFNNFIAVGDLMQGICTFIWSPCGTDSENNSKYQLRPFARLNRPLWVTDLEIVDEFGTILVADAEKNLLLLKPQDDLTESKSTDKEKKYEIIGGLQMHELINRIRRPPKTERFSSVREKEIAKPAAYFATADGGLYLAVLVSDDRSAQTLVALQSHLLDGDKRNLISTISGIGGVAPEESYVIRVPPGISRSWMNKGDEETLDFIDASVVETIIDQSHNSHDTELIRKTLEDTAQECNQDPSDIWSLVQDLKMIE